VSGLGTTADFSGLFDRLVQRAAVLGQARARARSLARRGSDHVWRNAGLLWPLFTMGAK
jgi:hypothetical protein